MAAKRVLVVGWNRPGASGAAAPSGASEGRDRGQAAGVIVWQAGLVGTGEAMWVVAEPGFEPGLEESKSSVLPLHHSAVRMRL